MSIAGHRATFTATNKSLKRARWIYSGLIMKACEKDRTGTVLVNCAKRAIKAGLYATPIEKDVRYSLLRKFWARTPAYHFPPFGWHCFVRDMHYMNGFVKKPTITVKAA